MKHRIIGTIGRASVIVALLILSACGSGIEGTYSNGGPVEYTFKSNGTVVMTASMMGVTQETEVKYEVEGNKVKLITGEGALLLTLHEDGSLSSPMGGKNLTRKD